MDEKTSKSKTRVKSKKDKKESKKLLTPTKNKIV